MKLRDDSRRQSVVVVPESSRSHNAAAADEKVYGIADYSRRWFHPLMSTLKIWTYDVLPATIGACDDSASANEKYNSHFNLERTKYWDWGLHELQIQGPKPSSCRCEPR
jgi:hypothetical protein